MAEVVFCGLVSLVVMTFVFDNATRSFIIPEFFGFFILVGLVISGIIAMDNGREFIELIGYSIVMVLGDLVYFIPSLVANHRKHQSSLAIFFTNLFLGWTVIGWIAGIIWAGTVVKNDS